MTSEFADEIYKGLPRPETDVTGSLWDVPPSNKKYTRSWPGSVDAEMYQVLQNLANNPKLPFQGNGSALTRHALAAAIESLSDQLEDGLDTMWERLRTQQRHLTNERYALHIEEILDKQVEFLREWSLASEWEAVLQDLTLADRQMIRYPNMWWRRRAVQGWLKHKGVRSLLEMWEDRMQAESPEAYAKVRRLFEKWDEVARV